MRSNSRFADLTTERLKFEYERRQREIVRFEMDISRLHRDLNELHEHYERDRLARPYAYEDAGSYPLGIDSIPKQIARLEERIHLLEHEMRGILDAFESKC